MKCFNALDIVNKHLIPLDVLCKQIVDSGKENFEEKHLLFNQIL